MARTPSLRASDLDREQIAERLQVAATEGRLRTDELEERLEATYSARTYGELDALVSDLPAPPRSAPPPARQRVPAWAGLAIVLGLFTLLALPMATVRRGAIAGPGPNVGGQPQAYPAPGRFDQQILANHAHGALVMAASVAALLAFATVAVAVSWLVTRARSGRRL